MRPRKHFRAKQRLLRIAQIAPLHENVSPHSYRGTQRIIAHLCQELARRGHEVTLFASYDSSARARLAPVDSNSLRASGAPRDGPERQLPVLCDVYENAGRFDIIHSHVGFRDFPLRRSSSAPTLSTMHNRLERTDLTRACQRYCDLPLVSISDRQREPLPNMNWIATVYHGLPADSYTFNPTVGNYLAFWGPFAPQQGPELAIEIARLAGVRLKVAAKIEQADREYYNTVLKLLLSGPRIEYVGEMTGSARQEFLGQALALVVPIDWPEPLGLVIVEALACGTPVIARACGAVSEILCHGVSGFISERVGGLADAVRNVSKLSRRACRREFDKRFTAERMATDYENIYHRLIDH